MALSAAQTRAIHMDTVTTHSKPGTAGLCHRAMHCAVPCCATPCRAMPRGAQPALRGGRRGRCGGGRRLPADGVGCFSFVKENVFLFLRLTGRRGSGAVRRVQQRLDPSGCRAVKHWPVPRLSPCSGAARLSCCLMPLAFTAQPTETTCSPCFNSSLFVFDSFYYYF